MTTGDVVDTMGYNILEPMYCKTVRYVMTLILYLGKNMKFMVTLTIYSIPLNKILRIIYIYGYLDQPMVKKIL